MSFAVPDMEFFEGFRFRLTNVVGSPKMWGRHPHIPPLTTSPGLTQTIVRSKRIPRPGLSVYCFGRHLLP
jgi:hypothetical protein